MTTSDKDDKGDIGQNNNTEDKFGALGQNSQRFDPPPPPQTPLGDLPTAGGQPPTRPEDAKQFNWFAFSFTNRLFKEYFVIAVGIWVVYNLVTILKAFITSITDLFTQAVYFKSAPVTMIKTIDWHILVLGGALIISITTIMMVMLRSVMNNTASNQEEKKQHSTWDDMPVSNFIEWALEKIKNKFK